MKTNFFIRHGFEWMVVCSLLVLSTGCRKQGTQTAESPTPASVRPQAPNDQQILDNIRSKVQNEQALNGQQIEVNVASGVVTLTGYVDSGAARALAAADSGAADGGRRGIKNLALQPPK